MDYFKLTNGSFVRVTDVSNELWAIDMEAKGNYASIYGNGLRYVHVSDIVYEINALDMAVHMLESMKQMDWYDSDHIMSAINLLKEKFQDELEFNIVSFSKAPTRPTIRIDIQELGLSPNYRSVIWSCCTTGWLQQAG